MSIAVLPETQAKARRGATSRLQEGHLTALEKGHCDAASGLGPYDDEKLGLQKVARLY